MRRELLLLAGATAATAALIGLGFWLGRARTLNAFERPIAEQRAVQTLGDLFPEAAQRQAVSRVFLDPAASRARFDEIAWAVPMAPAPFIGFGPLPGRHHNAVVNALQMRATRVPAMPKPSGTYRVFLTGGSVAFGCGAPSQETTIGNLLEQDLNEASPDGRRFEVFTLAAPGWTTSHERVAIEHRLARLAPDLVISLSGMNDAYLSSIQRDTLWSRSFGDQHFFDLLDAIHRRFAPDLVADVAPLRDNPVSPAEMARNLEWNVRIAATALAWVEAGYLFALQPNLTVSDKKPSPREAQILAAHRFRDYNRAAYHAVRERLRALDAPRFRFADFTDAFRGELDGEDVFIDAGHMGDRGNQTLARRLAEEVRAIAASPPR